MSEQAEVETCPKDGAELLGDPGMYTQTHRCPKCGTAYSNLPEPEPFFPEVWTPDERTTK